MRGGRERISPPGDLCILVVTCEAYRPLAELTGRILDRHWSVHPPTFYCGATNPSDERWFPLRDHPSDWMGIVLRATRDLRARGYRDVYLILEDHLPLFRCHAGHLNLTIPKLRARLDAALIALNGWGQGKPQYGPVLGPDFWWVEHLPLDFLWRFQLNPALWSLEALETVLEALVAELPLERRTPWAFERHGGRKDAPLPDRLKLGCYRVAGARMTVAPLRRGLSRAEKFGVHVLRFLARRVGGVEAWRRTDGVLNLLLRYYEGPYPLYRSGVLERGQINRSCLRFLALHGQPRLAREIADTVRGMTSPRPSI
jgi:hypothetical protein